MNPNPTVDGEEMKLVKLRDIDYEALVLEIETTFWKDELICHHCDLTPEDLDPLFNPIIKESLKYDSSIAYVNSKGEPISCVVNVPYKNYIQLKIPEKCSDKCDSLVEILGEIQSAYQAEEPETSVISFTWSTRSDYGRKGLMTQLLHHSLDQIKKDGYKSMMADCMNIRSQGAANKLGFVPKATRYYKPFVMKSGREPFTGIPADETIVRMVKYV